MKTFCFRWRVRGWVATGAQPGDRPRQNWDFTGESGSRVDDLNEFWKAFFAVRKLRPKRFHEIGPFSFFFPRRNLHEKSVPIRRLPARSNAGRRQPERSRPGRRVERSSTETDTPDESSDESPERSRKMEGVDCCKDRRDRFYKAQFRPKTFRINFQFGWISTQKHNLLSYYSNFKP
jgi:hypothetical protein